MNTPLPAGVRPPKSKSPPPFVDEQSGRPDSVHEALPEATTIKGVTFIHPEIIAGKSSVSITAKSCLSIEPAVMTSSGRFVPPSDGEASAGLLIRLRVSQDATPREYIARKFVPWANIGLVDFGL